jgi:hypothetical protein
MERKINLFTALIFAYSIIVCKVCKKDEATSDVFATAKINSIQDRELSKEISSNTNPTVVNYPIMAVNTISIKNQIHQ